MAERRHNFVDDLRADLDEFSATADALALDLRLDFTAMILSRLKALGWTQRDLAEATGLKESFISRVIHSNANCTLATIARITTALGTRVSLAEAQRKARGGRSRSRKRRADDEAA